MNKAEQEEPKQSRDEQYGEFVALLARHDEAIRRFVRSLLPHRDGIDDVVQETALECWRKYMDFTPESPESAADEFVRWACVIARYKVLSWKRDHARDRHVFRDSVIESLALDSMESLDERAIEEEAVEHCLQKLPVDQQTLVLSVHSPGNSVAEIAKKTGVKARRMYSKVNQLRRLLQECIEQRVAQESANGF
ncbi:MAG: sigma-70 family RNA polymerase sigma factor [Planctomycetota bacterium]